jgi:predicted phage replisome organizer
MADVKWIKIIVDVFDDEKIRLIETLPDADTILIVWFKLLTMAGKCNDNGIIYLTRDIPYNEEMLATLMRRPINTIRLALNEFQKLGMIDIKNNFIALLNWEKHQSLVKLEKMQIDTRLRVQKHREKQKELCNVTVTQCNATDKNRVDKNREDIDNNISDESFEIFWDLYQKKVNPKLCRNLWKKINPELHQSIFNHVREYVNSRPDKAFRKDPERYLKYEMWTSEIINEQPKNNSFDYDKQLEENKRLFGANQ